MALLYEDENTTREQLFELRKKNRCQVCHGPLDVFYDVDKKVAFLACQDWRRTQHEGIEREAPAPFEKNIPTRREEMVEELGEKKATALDKYLGVVSLTKIQAMDILRTIWPEAPDVEVIKAAMLCAQYGLNPLMGHIALIKFKRRNKKREVIGEDWVTVQEISSNRLIARRRHNYSYLDMTPRKMTDDEQKKINGEVDDTKIWALTHLKDVDTGAEAYGVGFWFESEDVYGEEKGNTPLNMAKIRSERQALNRLYPAEMPHGIEVMEAKYIEGEFTELTKVASSKPEGGEEGGEQAETPRSGEGKPAQTPSSPPEGEEKPEASGAPAAETPRDVDIRMARAAASKLEWDQKRLMKELKERTKYDTFEKCPDEELHNFASKITDLAELA